MEIKKRYDWENPAVIKRNKEDGHVIAFSYDNALDAAERKESPYKVTLNGKWNFCRQHRTKLTLFRRCIFNAD